MDSRHLSVHNKRERGWFCPDGKGLRIQQKHAWFLLHRIREMFTDKEQVPFKDIVEIDETYIKDGTKIPGDPEPHKQTQGRSFKGKTGVFGAATRDGRVKVVPVKDTKTDTLKPIIEQWVEKGSVIMTDEFAAYDHLNSSKDYLRESIKHKEKEWARGRTHTNTIESFWSLVKRTFYSTYHYVSRKHLSNYCNEVAFKWNISHVYHGKSENGDISKFLYVIQRLNGRLTYQELTEKPVMEVAIPESMVKAEKKRIREEKREQKKNEKKEPSGKKRGRPKKIINPEAD